MSSLKCLPIAPAFLFRISFLFVDKRFSSCLSYLFAISFLYISSNSSTVKPVNDLKSTCFLDNLSYESKERIFQLIANGHKAVYTNYTRDLYMYEPKLLEIYSSGLIYLILFDFFTFIKKINYI